MSSKELRDALANLFNNDTHTLACIVSITEKSVRNLLSETHNVSGPMRVLVRLLDVHPELVAELKAPIKKRLTAREKLDNLEAALVESILDAPDEEILEEIREEGGDPEAMAEQCRKIFEEAKGAADV